jgi:hypothetical protein
MGSIVSGITWIGDGHRRRDRCLGTGLVGFEPVRIV